MAKKSNLEQYRTERQDDASDRRTELIDVAEKLFLEQGIGDTTMIDIAEQAGVSRVTVYRYFSERDHLAYEVADRMLGRLAATARDAVPESASGLDAVRAGLLAFVTDFRELIDAHRFLAMFDHMTPMRSRSGELEEKYRERSLRAASFDDDVLFAQRYDRDVSVRLRTVIDTIMGVLARLAMQSELTTTEGDADLDGQLQHLAEMVNIYFDTSIRPHAAESA